MGGLHGFQPRGVEYRLRHAILFLGALAMGEAADFTYIAMEGYGGEVFRFEATSRLMTVRRREPALPGGTIGLSEFTAPPGSIEKLVALTKALPGKQVSMRPDTPVAVILSNGQSWTLPRPSPEWDAHLPLRAEVLRLAGEAEKHPVRALQIRWTSRSATEIAVELLNSGSQAVELDWTKVHVRAEGFIEMSKLPPDPSGRGPAPLPPANVTLGEYQAAPDAVKRIEPRGKVTVKVPVKYPHAGAWKIQARYECLSLPDGSKGIEGKTNSGPPVAAPKP